MAIAFNVIAPLARVSFEVTSHARRSTLSRTFAMARTVTADSTLAHDDPSTVLKLSSGRGVLSYVEGSSAKTSVASFAQGVVKAESETGDNGIAADVVHLDSSEETKKQQISFCAFQEVDDLINGVGYRTLDAKALEEVNYISRRDYREVKVCEIENDGSPPLPFFEVSYGNDRYDSRTMGAGEVALFFLWWSIDRASNNTILLIEEPETHLSPASQEALSHYLLKVAVEKRLNVILTSHSHKIINSFSENQLVFLFRVGSVVKTRIGLPPPALLRTIGIDLHVDTVVLVEDQLAEIFLRLMLERVRPTLSRRIEISIRNGHGDITSLLKRMNGQFSKVKVIGCYDGDMRGSIDVENVSAIVDGGTSAAGLVIQDIVKEKGRIAMFSGPATSDLTGKACSPLGFHWTYDTYALANTLPQAMAKSGADTWFFITSDYAFGHALERDATTAIERTGGKVLGHVRHPLGTSDFASFLLQAQGSGAKIIGLANSGDDSLNAIKQAAEFGIVEGGQRIGGLLLLINTIHGLGLKTSQGIVVTEAFYWDMDDETRRFSRRFEALARKKPNMIQAGVYSAVSHYLKSVQKAGSIAGAAVSDAMRSLPVNDFMSKDVRIRKDGRVLRDMHLFQVKSPSESKGPWDYYKYLSTVRGEDAFRPVAESECPLLR